MTRKIEESKDFVGFKKKISFTFMSFRIMDTTYT